MKCLRQNYLSWCTSINVSVGEINQETLEDVIKHLSYYKFLVRNREKFRRVIILENDKTIFHADPLILDMFTFGISALDEEFRESDQASSALMAFINTTVILQITILVARRFRFQVLSFTVQLMLFSLSTPSFTRTKTIRLESSLTVFFCISIVRWDKTCSKTL